MDKYKKYLADVLYQDALAMNRSELQDVSFYGEETTDKWTLENLQIQFVKDQMEFYESDNLDNQVEEILIFSSQNAVNSFFSQHQNIINRNCICVGEKTKELLEMKKQNVHGYVSCRLLFPLS